MLEIVIVLLGFLLSVFLFKKAAGTLNIGKINLVSYIMYLFFLQTYIGASLVFLGDRNHYTMKYLLDPDGSIPLMFYSVLLTAILFPLVIMIVHRIAKVNISTAYEEYLKKETSVSSERIAFILVAVIGAICCSLLLVYIIKIRYFPLLMILRAPAGFDFALERTRISNIVVGNQYINNVLIGMFIPLLSYIAFAYAVVLKKKLLWWLLALVLIGSSIVTVTCNFEKSPIIFYLFILLLILIYIHGGIPQKWVLAFGAVMVLAIGFIYIQTGYNFAAGDSNFYNGPIGRTLFTQVGTLAMHFDLFPGIFPFLGGRSLASTAMRLFGIQGESLRSAKLVMDFYGSEKVYDGTGGVMNSVFIGEAYANFGFLGMILSIVYMGVLIALLFVLFIKLKKTPFNIAISSMLIGKLALATQGGFTDFIYNFQTYLLLFFLIAGHFIPKIWNKIDGRFHLFDKLYQTKLGKFLQDKPIEMQKKKKVKKA